MQSLLSTEQLSTSDPNPACAEGGVSCKALLGKLV